MIFKFLSYFLNEQTPTYGGVEGTIILEKVRSINNGDTSNNLKFEFPGHVGTHIDFPHHFNNEGKMSNDYPASFWIFKKIGFLNCGIEEVENKIKLLPSDIELLILKTGFGSKRNLKEYWEEQPVIPASFAFLFKQNFPDLRIFGFDMISLTSKLNRAEGKEAHIQFLIKNDILILEDMNLSEIETAPSEVYISPLQIEKADGVPCTIIGSFIQ